MSNRELESGEYIIINLDSDDSRDNVTYKR